jgi:hypothetical protein
MDMTNIATKQCPGCAEEIKAQARVCKHCGTKMKLATNTRPIDIFLPLWGLSVVSLMFTIFYAIFI